MTAVGFGIFDHLDRRDVPLAQIYEERLQLLEAADAAGFAGYHIAEHHETPLAAAPSPTVFLTALSQRTRRLRFGPLVYPLPLYHPLRLIEEICILDQLSGGRLDLGVGRGISPFELAYHGVDPQRSREQFLEALQIITRGLCSSRLTFHGAFYDYDDVPMELQPLQRPYPPLWYPTTSEDGLRFAGRHNLNVVLNGRAGGVDRQVAIYNEARAAHANDPDRLNGHVAAPTIAVSYKLVLAETEDEALATARPAQRQHYASLVKLWRDFGTEPAGFTPDLDLMVKNGTALVGTPARVREQIKEIVATSGCTYLLLQLQFGGMTHAQALRTLRLFAEEVMPAFASTAVRSAAL